MLSPRYVVEHCPSIMHDSKGKVAHFGGHVALTSRELFIHTGEKRLIRGLLG